MTMYRVMIIDDEKYIRKSIRNRMDWEKFGITEIEEAGNGEEALALLDEFNPQIVLVDIRMPKMDGLAFIEEAKKTHPDIDYVILSAYSDFSYAKSAIKLGVEAYLLKPVDEEELGKLLQELLHKRKEEKLSRISRNIQTEPGGQEIPLHHKWVTALAFYSEKDEEYGARIEAVMKTETEQHQNCFSYYLRDCSRSTCYVFLLNTETGTQELAGRCAERVMEWIGDPDLLAAVSQAFEREGLQKAVSQSISYLKRKIFQPGKRLISHSVWETRDYTEAEKKFRQNLERVYAQISKGEFECVKDELGDLVDTLLTEQNSIAFIEEGIDEILVLLKHLPNEASGDMDFNVLFHDFRSIDYLLVYHTVDELRERLQSLIRRLIDMVMHREREDVVEKIKEYIERNYGDTLSVSWLADKYGLNVSYLSTLFKERTGINLVSYIEGIRMEKAKELLKGRQWSVTDIAIHTGYTNSNYFSKVFKKYTGISPREFRDVERKTGEK